MKTAGKITATLALLLGLYLLSYWLLFKKDWLYRSAVDPVNPFGSPKLYEALYTSFEPIRKLDLILNIDVPTKKRLTGQWHSDIPGDFVSLSPDQTCRFKLAEFAFEGKAEYKRSKYGFIMEFPHQGRLHTLVLGHAIETDVFGSTASASSTKWTATAFIEHSIDPLLAPTPVYSNLLTKQTPSAPAP